MFFWQEFKHAHCEQLNNSLGCFNVSGLFEKVNVKVKVEKIKC